MWANAISHAVKAQTPDLHYDIDIGLVSNTEFPGPKHSTSSYVCSVI